ncbi:MAG TPA: rod shape-determining protein MreC [Bacteroidia bacterium]|nr:rod shape-determining protein MreC [Bacteroidia bacterium]
MRAILNFAIKNYYYLLFALLQGLCVFLIFRNRSFQSTSLFNSANAVSAKTYQVVSGTKEYLALKEENQKLANENAMLKNLMRSRSYELISVGNFIKNDTLYRQKYSYLPAKIINNSTNLRSNYLTLNIGSAQGIVHDMAIINTEGIVGVVKDVSKNFSSALSILHKDVKVNCKLKKDGSYGPLSWEKDDDYGTATITDIPLHARFKTGDTIVTSALSSIFPEGIMVGKVKSFERKSGDPYFTVKVQLATQFKKLNHVYIIKNVFKAEQDSLQLSSQKPDKHDK